MKLLKRISLISIIMLALIFPASYSFAGAPVVITDQTSTATTSTVAVVDNQLRSIAQPYELAILEGNISGHTSYSLDGGSTTIGTAEQVLWGVAPGTQTVYVWPAVAATVTMVSTDATDNQAGVGARSVLITGLLAGYVASTETLLMHATVGTTAVTSAKEWLRISELEVVTAGSSGDNAGNITVLNGTDILSYIEAGTNRSLVAVDTVAAGETKYITSVTGSAAGTQDVDIHLYIRLFGGLFTQIKHRTVNDSPFSMSLIALPEKTDFMFRVHSGVAGGDADVTASGWTE